MVIFSLLATISGFIRYFIHIHQSRMGLLPIAIMIAFFFSSGLQSGHKTNIKQYVDSNILTLSRMLINCSVLIIFSLYSLPWSISSIICISINGFILGASLRTNQNDWVASTKSSIFFLCLVYLISVIKQVYSYESRYAIISYLGMILSLIAAFRSSYLFLLPLKTEQKHKLIYEGYIIYHLLFICTCIQIYQKTPFLGYIAIQLFISAIIYLVFYIRNEGKKLYNPIVDLDVEYILRGYRMHQIPKDAHYNSYILHPSIQKFFNEIPKPIFIILNLSSIIITVIYCIHVIYIGNNYVLGVDDFLLFGANTLIYILGFYYYKQLDNGDNFWRFFGFISTNICYYIVVAQVFSNDTVSILFRSLLRATANNLAMNSMHELKNYLGKTDYQYRLLSNLFGLLIISYFFLTLSLDILIKVAFLAFLIGIWLMFNKDNLKEIMNKS